MKRLTRSIIRDPARDAHLLGAHRIGLLKSLMWEPGPFTQSYASSGFRSGASSRRFVFHHQGFFLLQLRLPAHKDHILSPAAAPDMLASRDNSEKRIPAFRRAHTASRDTTKTPSGKATPGECLTNRFTEPS